jgi:thymidylate synthase
MQAYKDMINEVLVYGTRKENRTGIDTLSTFNHNYELCWDPSMYGNHYAPPGCHEMAPGTVPLLTTKEISWKNIVVEMLWFLSGSTDIEILQRHGCKFWDAWADEEGNVPSAYGNFWRQFPVHNQDWTKPMVDLNDQLAWVLGQLRTNPMSRRLVVSAWQPGNAQTSKLPPCHFAMCFNVQLNPEGEQRLCLHLTQRSCDLALGVPYNMASYGLLLLIMSHLSGIKPGIFAHTLLDLHIYTKKTDEERSQWDHLPGLKEQLERRCRPLPRVVIDPAIKELSDIETLMKLGVSTEQILDAFKLEGYDPAPAIKFKVAV